LLKEGMAFERNGNLVFVSMKKVTGLANDYPYKKGYEELKLDYDQPLLSVVDQLRYLLFKRKLKHQDYLIKLKHDNLKRSTQKKTSIKNFSPESVWHNTGIGMRKLSKHIGLSPSMTSKVTNDWVKNGLITKRPDREVIAKNVLVDEIELFREKIPGYLFVYNNTLFKYNYTNYSIL
jgi:DNA-binding MarR family transcriptional regulator